jgi:hypothetical protein
VSCVDRLTSGDRVPGSALLSANICLNCIIALSVQSRGATVSQDDLGSRESQRPPRRRRGLAWLTGLSVAAGVLAVGGIIVGNLPRSPSESGSSAIPTQVALSSPPDSVADSPAPVESATTAPAGSRPLAEFFVSDQGIANRTSDPQRISGTLYQNSIRFTVIPIAKQLSYLVYDTTNFTLLSATVGLPDDSASEPGDTVTVRFYQNDRYLPGSATVAVGHPQPVHINLDGSGQLAIVCTTADSAGQSVTMDVALGGAVLSTTGGIVGTQ